MTTSITGNGIRIYQALVLKQALQAYDRFGVKVNTAYTPKAMLATAGHITGQTFKRGQYEQAIAALAQWIETQRSTNQ